jgi:Ty3 transposon capsid-like protein
MPPRRTPVIVTNPDDHPTSPRISEVHEDEAPQGPERHQASESRQPSVEHETTASLTEAILLMTEELRRRDTPSRKVKAKEPDTFDGSDPRKLNNFILQCNLYFRSNPAYDDDVNKVTFALSYLRGTALEYFEPSILDSDEIPDWMDNWSAFVRTLRTQFGPIDPTADAEDGIDNLKMQDNQRILKYNVDFNRFAIRTGWDDSVLRHRYYTGLAERIKDIMGQQGKPSTLEAMKTLAHSIDSRHWERIREKSRSNKSKSDTHEKPDNKSNNKSDDKNKAPTSGNNNNRNNNSGNNSKNNNNQKSGRTPSTSGTIPSLSDKLGKDGKLTQQERQRRFDNHLCMFCGGTGHTAKDCPKSTSSASKAKARAAQAKPKETKESSDAKKD